MSVRTMPETVALPHFPLAVEKAWLVGIAPFIAASLIKNALGAALVPAMRRMFDRRG